MTGAQIVTKLENMVDDVLDSDFAYQLLNDAKDEIEQSAVFEQLKKETSFSVAAGYSYTSAAVALPDRMIEVLEVIEDGASYGYRRVDFDDRHARRSSSHGYFLDLAAGNLHLTGENGPARNMYLLYTQGSADIASGTSWAFPARFHRLLPLKMAELYYLADAGERGRSWDDKWAKQFERGMADLLTWNDRLKVRNRAGGRMRPTHRQVG